MHMAPPPPRGLLVAAHPAPSDPSTMLLKHPFEPRNLEISTRREDTTGYHTSHLLLRFRADAFLLHVEDRLRALQASGALFQGPWHLLSSRKIQRCRYLAQLKLAADWAVPSDVPEEPGGARSSTDTNLMAQGLRITGGIPRSRV